MNIIKSTISGLSGFLNIAHGYEAGKNSRAFRNWNPSFGSPDGEIITDLPKLRAYSRDLYRNNAVARGLIDLLVSNVIGRGLKMEPAMDRAVIQKYNGWDDETTINYFNTLEPIVKRDFQLWAESKESDVRGQRNFYKNQELAYKSYLLSGEVYAGFYLRDHSNHLFNFRTGLIEADQVQSPYNSIANRNNRDGLILDKDGIPIGVNINLNQETYPQENCFVPFFSEKSGRPLILHLYKADRPGQSRGVPFLTPIMQTLKHLADYKKSELIRAKVAALFAVFIKSPNPSALDNNGITQPVQDQSTIAEQGTDYQMGAGSIHKLLPGEEIQFANPGSISANYEPVANAMYTEIGMAGRTPLELLRRYYGASYSASRGAKNDYLKEVNIEREFMELDYCVPNYHEWFIEQVLAGRYYVPGFFESYNVQIAYMGSTWMGDAAGMIDPVKEIQASDMKVASGYSTSTEETASLTGSDYFTNLQIQKREEEQRKFLGLDKLRTTPTATQEQPKQE